MRTVKAFKNCTRQVMSLTSLIQMRLKSSVSSSTSLKRTYLTKLNHLKGRARSTIAAPSNSQQQQLDFASRSMTRGPTWMKRLDKGSEKWSHLKEVQQTLSFKRKARMLCQASQRWECSLKRRMLSNPKSNPKRTYRNKRTSTSEAKERQKMTLQKSWKIWRSLNSTKKKC